MKKSKKRLCAAILATFTVFTSVFSGITNVMAASSSSNLKLWYASSKEHGVVTEFNSYTFTGNIMYAMLDGLTAYCMNYARSADGGQKMQSSGIPKTAMSAEQEKQLGYCMHYGHARTTEGSPTNAERNEYVATQAMVWIIEKGLFGTDKADSAAQKLCACAPSSADAYDFYLSLRDKVTAAMSATVPSFAATTENGASVYELKWNERNNRFETTLSDTNGVLSKFDFSASGFSVSKNGNQLSIYSEAVNTSPTLLSGSTNNGVVQLTESCVYWTVDKEKYQEFVSSRPEVQPLHAYFKVKTENVGYGHLTKRDQDTKTGLANAVFGVYSDSECTNLVTKATTGSDGTAKTEPLVARTYYAKELVAPKGYVLSKDVQTLVVRAGQTTRLEFFNERVTATIKLSKVDADSQTPLPQGEASIKGAQYGLYARNDILHPDGASGVIYKANDLVTTMMTNENGKDEVSNLYLGNYYVKELSPSEGYVLDQEEHDVVCDYEGDLVAEVTRSVLSQEKVITQPFQLIKVSDDGKQTNAPLVEGAGFKAYLKSTLPIKEDGSYDLEKATPIVIGCNGETELFTNEEGYVCSIPIPYGTYVIVESTTPHNMKTVEPFELTISQNNPQTPQIWRVLIDREFTAKLRIVKKDSNTGKTVLVPNAEFKIYNMDKNEYISMTTTYPSKVTHTSFFTDKDGDLILPDTLKIGRYRIEEVSAPYGYVRNQEPVYVSIDTNTFYLIDPDTNEAIITVSYENEPARGELLIKKRGEVLTDYKGGFIYKEVALAGVQFEVYANEDIYTADMQLDVNGNRTKYYSNNDLVATVVTDKDGVAKISELPLGTYRVVEVGTPKGYVIDTKEHVVKLEYKDDVTSKVEKTENFYNDRQKLCISIHKKDAKTQEAVAGALFGIYTKSAIIDADGKVILESDVLLETATSDASGQVHFTKDYPLQQYYVKEIQAPSGYVKSEEVFVIDASGKKSNDKMLEFRATFLNEPIEIEETSPKTGDTLQPALWGGVIVTLLGLCFIYLLSRLFSRPKQ